MASFEWREAFEAPPTAGARPHALLKRLGELLTALDPQHLDPIRSGASATYGGSVFATLCHRTEDLAEITIDCSGDGLATISSVLLGSPDEVFQLEDQSLEDWCADVLNVVTDALLQHYTLTEYRRSGQLRRTRITSDSPEQARSITVSEHWTGLLPVLKRRLDRQREASTTPARASRPPGY